MDKLHKHLISFIQQEFELAGRWCAFVGLSGGVDSAVVCTLCAKALGPENVWAVKMPYRTSSPSSIEDADTLIDQLNVNAVTVYVTPLVEAYSEGRDLSPVRLGNITARCRMIVLYDMAAELRGLVAGTGNLSEGKLGYTTLHGDSACDFSPIGNLYKTEVYQLARCLGVPECIINKPPSAGLWTGQTDEGELGYPYSEIDKLLIALADGKSTDAFDPEFVSNITNRIAANQFKGRMPNIGPRFCKE